jgi:hypothetical protein
MDWTLLDSVGVYAPLGWCWGLGLTFSLRKNSVVTKLREQGGHASEKGRKALEDESCYGALKSATTSSSQFLSSSQQVTFHRTRL